MFEARHIEQNVKEVQSMLDTLGVASLDELVTTTIPKSIREGNQEVELPEPLDETTALQELKKFASQNTPHKSFIGQGYHGSIMPSVIKRNIFENPAWYTAYTAYQSEISQGRLEALFNFQTLTTELTGLPIATASLLDEGTSVAEALQLACRFSKDKRNTVTVMDSLHPQNLAVLRTRMSALDIAVQEERYEDLANKDYRDSAAVVLQLPNTRGEVYDVQAIIAAAKKSNTTVIAAIDPMFLVLAGSPAAWGVDIVVGSFQRFGLPFGFGGPHAAFLAVKEEYKRLLPGRIVGETVDAKGRKAYRFALQTREQHIRREKATSNICTSQVLLAVINSMYAVYHGYDGLRRIALQIFSYAYRLRTQLKKANYRVLQERMLFDTVCWDIGEEALSIHAKVQEAGYNIRMLDAVFLSISFDETTTEDDFRTISTVLGLAIEDEISLQEAERLFRSCIGEYLVRAIDTKPILTQTVFNLYRTETEMMRYMRYLMDKDLALDRSMIPLGSCTMKLNPASALFPISWDEFANVHPFAPLDQSKGFQTIISQLEAYLCTITGYDKISLQPNAGSQGEYAGLLAIKAYYKSKKETHRNICLIPSSAHGTNPASARIANLEVVVVACDSEGNIDVDDLKEKVSQYADKLAVLMITYPSTHGVFETRVKEVCDIIHAHGGQVYVDGANLNALVGLVKITGIGADVSHLNLHKTFAIPHGGGGPGVGPVGVKSHLAPFLPENILMPSRGTEYTVGPVSSAPWGSALVLIISWMYIRMMGRAGLVLATQRAILHANYIAKSLSEHYNVLYKGQNGRVAHECILDMREFKQYGVETEDIAKRLIDYGFHAPTMSWPVVSTLMVEPTECESKHELDRFCNAMKGIRDEIEKVISGAWPKDDNPLVNAPHCAQDIAVDKWTHPYSRTTAAYPYETDTAKIEYYKYWSPVSRVDNAYGDKNLVCSCPPIEVTSS